MSSAYSDLFEVEEDNESSECGLPEITQVFAGAAAAVDPDSDHGASTWFSVCVLTVPDLGRFPLPAQFVDLKQPVDLSTLADLSAGEVRKLILPSLPDEQLDEIEAAEKSREKPRQMVLTAVTSEKLDRGLPCTCCGHVSQQFAEWVSAYAANPLSSRIAAVAWLEGNGEIQSIAPASLEEEAAALSELLKDWKAFDTAGGFSRIASWDLDSALASVTARRQLLGVGCEHDDFKPCYQITGRNWRQFAAGIGGIEKAAEALGIAHHEIPAALSPVDVFRLWRQSPGSVELIDAAASRLVLERELLRIVQACW